MAIKITTYKSDRNFTGKSHVWGAPDLPIGVPYPTITVSEGNERYEEPLTFVCQVRCNELAAFDEKGVLPHEGMLYFFAPIDYFQGEEASPIDYHEKPVVIYHPTITDLQPYEIKWEGSDESIFRPAEEIVFKTSDKTMDDGMVMLGMPYQEDVAMDHTDDVCLLQLDSEDKWNLRFFDMGMYYFFIPKEALDKGNWNEVMGELFTY